MKLAMLDMKIQIQELDFSSNHISTFNTIDYDNEIKHFEN
mgnify:CR=1 FL=1